MNPNALLLIALLSANTTPPHPAAPGHVQASSAPQAGACRESNRQAIRFWIGDWNVFPTGSLTSAPIATSRIEWIVGGCAVRETYVQTTDESGKPTHYEGTSYTAFNVPEGVWKQFYVDTSGRAALLTGVLTGSSLVLSKEAAGTMTRMTLRAEPDSAVRQIVESSVDKGKTWTLNFDLTYRHPESG